jgi:hypothetical protein
MADTPQCIQAFSVEEKFPFLFRIQSMRSLTKILEHQTFAPVTFQRVFRLLGLCKHADVNRAQFRVCERAAQAVSRFSPG